MTEKQNITVLNKDGKLLQVVRRKVTKRHTIRLRNRSYQVQYFGVKTAQDYFGYITLN